MLARYQIIRGKKPLGYEKPSGVRKDIRYFRNHFLSPTKKMIVTYLDDPSDSAWKTLEKDYLQEIEKRFKIESAKFDSLKDMAMSEDVYIGCSCPTKTNPDVFRCHTVIALKFMKKKFPKLKVQLPSVV